MKRLFILFTFAVLACNLFTPIPVSETPALVTAPVETFAPVCTPPACTANETYFCHGDCPGGCGTVCATVTPETAVAPLATVQGAGEWIVRTEERLVFLDPGGAKPGFALQRLYAPVVDFFLVRDGNIFSLIDTGSGSLALHRVYPREHWIADLDTRRGAEGNPRIAPIFSSDDASLVWSRAEEDGAMTRAVFTTSLETGESREVWRAELPPEAGGHAIVPLFYDASRGTLVYALHAFYSGMTPTQVASLYVADTATNEITPLWTLKPDAMYAGVSATVSADGRLLAYLTWGEPQADFTLPWTLHLRDLSNGTETTHRLTETWGSAEVHLFSPDGNKLLFTASRRTANGDYQTEMVVFDLETEKWNSIYTPDYETKPYLTPRAWSAGNWLIITSEADSSTWVMHPDGESLTQITVLEWAGLLQP